MNHAGFNPRTVLALLVIGAAAFFAALWFIGQGDTGPGPDNGEAHAQSNGVAGYAGLVSLLRHQGLPVEVSRSRGRLDEESLLVLTPSAWADPDEITEIIESRRYSGGTLLILPKWSAVRVPGSLMGTKKGWVRLLGAARPGWSEKLEGGQAMSVELAALDRSPADWQGLGLEGSLPDRSQVLALEQGGQWSTLVRDSQGRDLVSYASDEGCYPVLDEASGNLSPEDCENERWNLTVVFEPDLFNNYGMADRNRALLAARIVELAREEQNVPVVFDLTLNGFGATRNLMTLAFQPPFLAATLCLLLALLVVAWRGFGRFGPPLAEARTLAFGKARLAANAAGFIRRSGRLHLLGPPYVELVARRLAAALALRRADPEAIDAALARRNAGTESFSHLAERLRSARGPSQTLRAAHALKSLERTVTR